MSRFIPFKMIVLVLIFGVTACEKAPLVESTLLVPLKVSTLWPDQVVSELKPQAIQLLVKGPAADLTNLEKSAITYSIDHQPRKPGLHQIPINITKFRLPDNVTAIKTTPDAVMLKTEAKVAKFVKVIPQIVGSPKAGWTIAAITVEPAIAKITGGASHLIQLDQIISDSIAIDNISETLNQPEVKLVVPESVTLVGPETVDVTVNLAADQVTHTWTGLTVALRGSQNPATVHPRKVTLRVRGPQSELDLLDNGHAVDLFVDLTGLDPGVYVRRAVIRLPLEVALVEASPALFTVTISDPK